MVKVAVACKAFEGFWGELEYDGVVRIEGCAHAAYFGIEDRHGVFDFTTFFNKFEYAWVTFFFVAFKIIVHPFVRNIFTIVEEDVIGEVDTAVVPFDDGCVLLSKSTIDDGDDTCDREVAAVEPIFDGFELVDGVEHAIGDEENRGDVHDVGYDSADTSVSKKPGLDKSIWAVANFF